MAPAVKITSSPAQMVVVFGVIDKVAEGKEYAVITIGPKVVPQFKPFATSTVTDAPFVKEEELNIFDVPVCMLTLFTLKLYEGYPLGAVKITAAPLHILLSLLVVPDVSTAVKIPTGAARVVIDPLKDKLVQGPVVVTV